MIVHAYDLDKLQLVIYKVYNNMKRIIDIQIKNDYKVNLDRNNKVFNN